MILGPDQLNMLATSVYGPEWQSRLARERDISPRTVQRWAKDGIAKPDTAIAIRAYLLSRRVVDFPFLAGDDDHREDTAYAATSALLHDLVGASAGAGWHEADLLTALLSALIDRMAERSSPPATIEALRAAIEQLRQRDPSDA